MAKTKEKSKKKKHSKPKEKVKEKKISKKQKSKPQIPEKPEKHNQSEKKPKKSEKKSKKTEKKHKKPEKSEVLEPQVAHPDNSLTTQTPVATKELGSDSEYDPGYLRQLLESYSKEQLVDLICTTAQKGSRLISVVIESAERDATQRRIFVHGLGWDTTRENLVAAFEPYGEIEDCTVIMDKATGRAKGFGFVLFKTLKGAREALKNPHKRLFNRTIMCHLASERPSGGGGKVREMAEPVKIDLPQTANHGQVPGHEHHTGPVLAGQGMPFFGQPPGLNPMYGGLMGNLMLAGVPNYTGFGSGVMSQGLLVPPNHVGVVGQYGGDGARGDSERAWYLR